MHIGLGELLSTRTLSLGLVAGRLASPVLGASEDSAVPGWRAYRAWLQYSLLGTPCRDSPVTAVPRATLGEGWEDLTCSEAGVVWEKLNVCR